MEFARTSLKEEFSIKRLISLHYFEFARDFIFTGEKHDFWEFLYVDKGEVEVMADTNGYVLKQGDIIFHKPNEFHSVWANKKIAPNVIVISFECKSKQIDFFENKLFSLEDAERNILASIIKEGFDAFTPPFDNPAENVLYRNASSNFGSEQLIKINLEHLLINIIRIGSTLDKRKKLSSTAKERSENDAIKRIVSFMKESVTSNLTLPQLCKFSNMSKTHLINLFKEKTGYGVIDYFKNLKIEQAKVLIREQKYNFTEIADILNYSSIHCFSRHFKKVTDTTPSEYARSVKARIL